MFVWSPEYDVLNGELLGSNCVRRALSVVRRALLSSAVRCLSFAVRRLSFAVRRLSSAVRRLSSAVLRLSFAVRRLSFAVRCQHFFKNPLLQNHWASFNEIRSRQVLVKICSQNLISSKTLVAMATNGIFYEFFKNLLWNRSSIFYIIDFVHMMPLWSRPTPPQGSQVRTWQQGRKTSKFFFSETGRRRALIFGI